MILSAGGFRSPIGAMTAPQRNSPVSIVGWREWIALPDLGIGAIKAKIDTGARSSSLHAFNIETFDRGGAAWVRFDVHPMQRNAAETVRTEAKVLEFRHIRSSSGHQTLRPVIRTRVLLGGRGWLVDLTLAARDEMGFRMLLGREALRRRFVVDAGQSYLVSSPARRKATGKKTPKRKS
jgi:hypothetical protein